MKKYFNLFLFISLLFLLISLYRSNYLKIPQIVSYPELIASIVLLLNGFLLDALCWKKTLDFHQYRISLRMGVVSVGLTIFGKYIPGKIWTALGRSSYLARRNVGNGGDVVYISFIAQLMLIWTGLIVGCVSLFTLQLPLSMIFGIIVLLCGLPALILSRPFHNAMSAEMKDVDANNRNDVV